MWPNLKRQTRLSEGARSFVSVIDPKSVNRPALRMTGELRDVYSVRQVRRQASLDRPRVATSLAGQM